FSDGLKKSLFNYMHGMCFEDDLQTWFDFEIPATNIDENYILDCIESVSFVPVKSKAKVVWLGDEPLVFEEEKKRRGKPQVSMEFFSGNHHSSIRLDQEIGEWLYAFLQDITVSDEGKPSTYGEMKAQYEAEFGDFEPFWCSKPVATLRQVGLIIL
ncbi:MAG: radical SAM protein, partial [Bacteroidota bacterium]